MYQDREEPKATARPHFHNGLGSTSPTYPPLPREPQRRAARLEAARDAEPSGEGATAMVHASKSCENLDDAMRRGRGQMKGAAPRRSLFLLSARPVVLQAAAQKGSNG